jgi:hypothetical protein
MFFLSFSFLGGGAYCGFPEMEFLDIPITNRKPYSTPFSKTHAKNPRNKNSRAYSWKACWRTEHKGRILKSKKIQVYAQKPWHKKCRSRNHLWIQMRILNNYYINRRCPCLWWLVQWASSGWNWGWKSATTFCLKLCVCQNVLVRKNVSWWRFSFTPAQNIQSRSIFTYFS